MSEGCRDDMTMEDIMRMWPATIRVLLDHGLLCVGCPFARFQTVDDAIREHGIDGDRFRKDLYAVIGAAPAAAASNRGRCGPPPAAPACAAASR